MPISGTHAAGEMVEYKDMKTGLDIDYTGTYADTSTWSFAVRIDRGTVESLTQKSHGGTSETATADQPQATIEIDFFHTGAATDPYWNLAQEFESTDKRVNVKLSKNSLTAPTSGDFTWTLTAGKLVGLTDPTMVRETSATISSFTATITGTLATTQAP